ncbi:MAG TPA: 16S rRNA (guanine(966)-N(2))-methyltransferase RsmD [Microthrixaceae bacterium]|nr:16S rRNA (guanine(966)-N(2))-methyltransferase RsmD [Microthrixaceae bacterium]
MGLRVVAGSCRGRRLVTPEGNDVRPTSDRVREAVFNSLGSMDALRGASVLDLFAGSGAMGIEALSRGAASATFVDESTKSVKAIAANLRASDLEGSATVKRSDALRFLRDGPGHFDLIVLDPPYEFDEWDELLQLVDASTILIESNRSIELPAKSRGGELSVAKDRRYGGTVVMIAIAEGRGIHDRTSEGRT